MPQLRHLSLPALFLSLLLCLVSGTACFRPLVRPPLDVPPDAAQGATIWPQRWWPPDGVSANLVTAREDQLTSPGESDPLQITLLPAGAPGVGAQGGFQVHLAEATRLAPEHTELLVDGVPLDPSAYQLNPVTGIVGLMVPNESWGARQWVTLSVRDTTGRRGRRTIPFAFAGAPRSPWDEMGWNLPSAAAARVALEEGEAERLGATLFALPAQGPEDPREVSALIAEAHREGMAVLLRHEPRQDTPDSSQAPPKADGTLTLFQADGPAVSPPGIGSVIAWEERGLESALLHAFHTGTGDLLAVAAALEALESDSPPGTIRAPMMDLARFGPSSPSGAAPSGAAAALAVMLTAPGLPILQDNGSAVFPKGLERPLQRLVETRRDSIALRQGVLRILHSEPERLVFARVAPAEAILVSVVREPASQEASLLLPETFHDPITFELYRAIGREGEAALRKGSLLLQDHPNSVHLWRLRW